MIEPTLRALEIGRVTAVRKCDESGRMIWTADIEAAGVKYRRTGPTLLSALAQAVDAAHDAVRL